LGDAFSAASLETGSHERHKLSKTCWFVKVGEYFFVAIFLSPGCGDDEMTSDIASVLDKINKIFRMDMISYLLLRR
jgi:hypothetical protein